jgi:ATP-binding cassette subfamily F protein 3
VEKKVEVLSGGEKARLALAKLLLRPANLLVLDEPTNHLDVAACEVLEEALSGYQGTLLFISHDRSFINALATRVVEVHAGRLASHPGNYDDYLRRASGRASPDAGGGRVPAEPKRARMEERRRTRERARALETSRRRLAALEEEISGLEKELEAVGHRLGDPALYRDGDAVRALEAERVRLREAVDGRYRDWERLAAEIEAAEDAAGA